MKSKGIFVAIAFMLIMVNFALVNAEITVNGFRSVVGTNETKNSMTILIDDTSIDGTLKATDNNISIYINHYLNYTLASGETVTVCLYNAQQTKNEYDADGNLLNSTVVTETVIYNYSATSIRYYTLKDKDTLKADLDCFWDRDINDSMFQYLSPSVVSLGASSYSYACGDCARQDYEETVTEYIETKQQSENYFSVFNSIMTFSLNNLQIWYMGYWIIKIALWIVLIMLAFMGGIWLYHFFKDIARNI